MDEQPLRRIALCPARLAQGPHAAASLAALSPASRFIFRGNPLAAELVGAAFGVSLSIAACRANQAADRAALWLGPDEWLLLAPEDAMDDVRSALIGALGEQPHALVAICHRNTALEISGPQAATVLNAGCPLDLHVSGFPVGMCTRTVLGKAEIILWRTADAAFRLEVWRSYAPYVWDFLIEARARL
jgi:sarcosine oxidase subunit gamma